MTAVQSLFAILATILALASYDPYIRGILKGKTKPHRSTFGIWTLIGIVASVSYLASGGKGASGLIIAYTVGTLVIFLLSIKRGVGGASKLDIFCLLGSMVGVAGWIVTNNPHVALYFNIFAGFCGYLPTFKKAYLKPKTENAAHWVLCTFAAISSLFAISEWSVFAASIPVYLLICDGSLALLTVFPESLR